MLVLGSQLFAQTMVNTDKPYGKNLLTFEPFHAFASPEVSDVAVGVSYERFINDYASFKVPFHVGLINNSFQTGLGVKFYPGGHAKPVKYAIAPTIVYTGSNRDEEFFEWDPVTQQSYSRIRNQQTTQLGFVLNSSLNVTIQNNLYFGMETGLGINYLNRTRLDNGVSSSEGPNVNILFNISLGYRF